MHEGKDVPAKRDVHLFEIDCPDQMDAAVRENGDVPSHGVRDARLCGDVVPDPLRQPEMETEILTPFA